MHPSDRASQLGLCKKHWSVTDGLAWFLWLVEPTVGTLGASGPVMGKTQRCRAVLPPALDGDWWRSNVTVDGWCKCSALDHETILRKSRRIFRSVAANSTLTSFWARTVHADYDKSGHAFMLLARAQRRWDANEVQCLAPGFKFRKKRLKWTYRTCESISWQHVTCRTFLEVWR